MCGINGFTWEDEELIKRMNTCTKHRGPDGTGVHTAPGITLGQNRLAILDPQRRSDQPFWDNDRKVGVVYNGELYNFKQLREELKSFYKFKTTGDTEVLVAAYLKWGRDMLKRLNGMFAFAIWDTRDRSLFVARDQIGIKPLYYHHEGEKFMFSSELKALLEAGVPRKLNEDAFAHYLRLLYVPEPFSLVANVYKLPPAHYLVIKDGEVTCKRYWDGGDYHTPHEFSLKEIEEHIDKAVERQLVSDKPLGVYLSGGIDSSVVLDCATKADGNMDTFSVGFDLTEEEDAQKFNHDFELARRTAKHYGARHHELLISSDDAIEILPQIISHMEEPISNATSISQFALAKFSKAHVDVVLGGDGGDEMFAGYPRHRFAYIMRHYQKLPSVIRSLLNQHPRLRKLNTPSGAPMIAAFHFQKDKTLERVIAPEFVDTRTLDFFDEHFVQGSRRSYEELLMDVDRSSWLVDESLMRTDRTGMAHGLEARVPLLDREVVEYALGIPARKQLHLFDTKRLLKQAFRSRLPDYLFDQPKRGWFSPGAKWLRHKKMDEYVRTVLSPEYAPGTASLFIWPEITKMLDQHKSKEQYHYTMLWALLTFQIWAKKYSIETTR